MSADRRPLGLRLLLAGALAASTAATAADEMPDPEFLEYLGMWEAADDEWLLVRDEAPDAGKSKEVDTDPMPEGEESTEKVDE